MSRIRNTEYKNDGNALKGQNNSAWGNALRNDGNSGLLHSVRNDVHLTPTLSKGEGVFPSFGGVRRSNQGSDK